MSGQGTIFHNPTDTLKLIIIPPNANVEVKQKAKARIAANKTVK